ncbi:MAG: hypothetical protein ABW046_21220 [Actinoplanes sp.]
MTSTIELERLVRPSDLSAPEGRHRRHPGWLRALALVAAITALAVAVVA